MAELATDVLAAGSTFLVYFSEEAAICPSMPFPPSFSNLYGNRGGLAKASVDILFWIVVDCA